MTARGATLRPKAVFAALICGLLTTASALAENVPLPTPAPLPKTGGAMPPASMQPAPAAANSAPADSQPKGFFPFTPNPKRAAGADRAKR